MESPQASLVDSLDRSARFVRDVLWDLEDPRGGVYDDADLKDKFKYYLQKLYVQVLISLEHLGLVRTRGELFEAWTEFESTGLDEFVYYSEPGVVGSKPYDLLDSIIEGIRGVEMRGGIPHDRESELQKLEQMLGRTAYLLERRSVDPTKESDVQHVMDDYLEAMYGADYRRQFSIPGVVKNFKPDSGIISLGAVIEFKFVDSKAEFKTAVAGLFEDAGGYRPSADWSKYFSVIYMTGAHGTLEQAIGAFESADMVDWAPIIVTGSGGRKKRKK